MDKIYFDYASTTPADPMVIEAMQPFFYERFGNASSPHGLGQEALKALEESRSVLARFIGAHPEEIIFNSGATEGNNHAVFGIVRRSKGKGKHIVISSIEHHSVLEAVEYLQREEGYKVTFVPVGPEGLVDPQRIKDVVTAETLLIAVMHANNEIGTIQPIAEISKIAREHKIPFLVDAVQTVGHIPVNVDELGADLLTLSAHKFYGPKGVGAMYVRKGFSPMPLLFGGDQERGRRASTQNVAGAVGLAKAVELCREKMAQEASDQRRWRDRLLEEVLKRVDGARVNGSRTKRLPNNAHFSFEGVEGESLLMSLDMAGMAASMGSACKAGAMEPSHVLRAIGISDALAHGALRISLGRWTKEEDIDRLLEHLPQMVGGLRV